MVESGFPAARSLSRAERGGSLSLPMQYVFPEDNQTRNQINPDMKGKIPQTKLGEHPDQIETVFLNF